MKMPKYLYGSPIVQCIRDWATLFIALIVPLWLLTGCNNSFANNSLECSRGFHVHRSANMNSYRQNISAWTTMNPNLVFSTSPYQQQIASHAYFRNDWPSTPLATEYTTNVETITYEENLRLRQIDGGRTDPRNVLYREVRGYRWVHQTK
jgi:hypothetical protein